MYTIRKLKPDRNFSGLLIPIGYLVIAVFLGAFIGYQAAMTFFTIVFWLYAAYGLLTWARTRNNSYIVQFLYLASAGLATFFLPRSIERHWSLGQPFVALTVFFAIWLFILAGNKKLKWRGREVLELAAASVEDTGNGYTSRPLPAGKTEFSQRQILAFAQFALKNMIAVTYQGKDKVIFVPVLMGREFPYILGLKSDYTDETWVAFDYEGKVTVNISHRDYLEYQDALSFDQLCKGMGDLFVEFMGMFQNGEGVRIIDRMDALRIGFYS